ncbi:MAG: DUF5814 domain-containing protein [Candidatus Heimdallarchaeaceae archaeon]
MKIPKPYIAVLFNFNKEKLSTDIIYFHVSGKKDKKAVSHCRLQFIYEKNLLRVYKYLKLGRNTVKYIRPKEATEDLKNASYLVVDKSDLPFNQKGFIEYFNTFKIKKPKVANICRYCLNKQRWTELGEEDNVLFKGKSICKLCIRRELITEIKRTSINFSAGIIKFYEQQARRKGSLDEVLNSITLGVESNINDKESTLFDIIRASEPDISLKVEDLKTIPSRFKDLLIKEGVKNFLPAQKLALESGLLEKKDLLIVAGTSSGKTLIGELAGITNLIKEKKRFIYLSPLVALTNQKYEHFRKRYRKISFKTSIKVGMSRIVTDIEKPIVDGSLQSDIIVATYEALDFVLRDGRAKELGNVGTICIDEIQMLMAKERGFRLNGLITRLKALFPRAQFIYLSATIGNPKELAEELNSTPVIYTDRPIPLERHVILTDSEEQRINFLVDLCRKEERIKSSMGYKGQTLVFTNSRKGCEKIANLLTKKGVRATHYHAGLTYSQRKKIESKFETGAFSTVVTTIALGAGVDFPASLVIFENLAMGVEWLTVAEFHQMLGRAGRFGFHDKGKVYLLVEPGRKIYSRQDLTEEQIAFKLLTQPIEPVEPVLDTIEEQEEVLAIINAVSKVKIDSRDKMIFSNLLGRTNKLSDIVKNLVKMEMLEFKDKTIYPTKLGKATSLSFLAPPFALRLVQEIKRRQKNIKSEDLVLDLAVSIRPFTAAYLSSRLQAEVERLLKSTISTSVFSGAILDLYSGESWGIDRKPSSFILDTFSKWTKEIFVCDCPEKPFCDCGEKTFSKIIVNYRLNGYNPTRISTEIRKNLNIQVYPGDIYSWLDQIVHSLEAVKRLSSVLKEVEIEKTSKNIGKRIENPKNQEL